jgi:hypothetical protein
VNIFRAVLLGGALTEDRLKKMKFPPATARSILKKKSSLPAIEGPLFAESDSDLTLKLWLERSLGGDFPIDRPVFSCPLDFLPSQSCLHTSSSRPLPLWMVWDATLSKSFVMATSRLKNLSKAVWRNSLRTL